MKEQVSTSATWVESVKYKIFSVLDTLNRISPGEERGRGNWHFVLGTRLIVIYNYFTIKLTKMLSLSVNMCLKIRYKCFLAFKSCFVQHERNVD